MIGSLCWKPFDARFGDLVGQLKFHQEVLKDEIAIHEFQRSHDARVEGVEERRKAADGRETLKLNYNLSSEIRESQLMEACGSSFLSIFAVTS